MALLEDVRNTTKQYKNAVYLPTIEEIENLKAKDVVKLVFSTEVSSVGGGGMPSGERMWVKIITKQGDDFVGELLNSPAVIKDLEYGDELPFNSKHILEIDLEIK